MKIKNKDPRGTTAPRHDGSTIRLTLSGLVILCVSLISVSMFLTHLLAGHREAAGGARQPATLPGSTDATNSLSGDRAAPWGELISLDVDIEQPMEYVSFEATTNRVASWTFPGTSLEQVRTLMLDSGMTKQQTDTALGAGKVTDTPEAIIVKPDDELILSLPQQVRSKLYVALAAWPVNKLMREPYHVDEDKFEALFLKNGVDAAAVRMVKELLYMRGNHSYFSDVEPVLHAIPSEEGRVKLLKSLTAQSAVLARMRIRSDTDLDKMLGYWGKVPGVHAKDLRPLLESIKNTPEGSTISLLYFLPPFARERLYTFPLPSKPGDPKMDCHWTALNFFNEVPDDRLQDNAYASKYIEQSFYQIGKPSMCGDLIFLLDGKGEVIHSAVYIAEDIVFTKNGVNYAQPWILMRQKNLLGLYTVTDQPKVLYYRRKEA